jgi:hypothetical protein
MVSSLPASCAQHAMIVEPQSRATLGRRERRQREAERRDSGRGWQSAEVRPGTTSSGVSRVARLQRCVVRTLLFVSSRSPRRLRSPDAARSQLRRREQSAVGADRTTSGQNTEGGGRRRGGEERRGPVTVWITLPPALRLPLRIALALLFSFDRQQPAAPICIVASHVCPSRTPRLTRHRVVSDNYSHTSSPLLRHPPP